MYPSHMTRAPYSTDLTDAQWEILAPLIPDAPPWGRPRSVDIREVVNAILYVTRHGISWRALPHDFPKASTVYRYFSLWLSTGLWETINDALRVKVRTQVGKHPEPSAGIIDSQSVKSTAIPGDRGYDAGKQVNGRKRSVIVDTLGMVLRVVVHPADWSDLQGGKMVAELVGSRASRLEKLFGDQHYRGSLRSGCGNSSVERWKWCNDRRMRRDSSYYRSDGSWNAPSAGWDGGDG
jgi:putative transposase